MEKAKRNLVERLSSQRKRAILYRRALALLCVAVLLATSMLLRYKVDALNRIPTCGYTGHEHTAECYDASGQLICTQHVHTDACYQQRPEEDDALLWAEDVVPDASVDMEDTLPASGEVEAGAQEEQPDELQSVMLGGEPEELQDVILGGEPEDVPANAKDAVEDSEPSEYVYSMNGNSPVALSDILAEAGVPVRMEEIEFVGPVEDTEEASGKLGVQATEDGLSVVVLRNFQTAELAVFLADDIYIVKLTDGIAASDAVSESAANSAPSEAGAGNENMSGEEQAETSLSEEDTPSTEIGMDASIPEHSDEGEEAEESIEVAFPTEDESGVASEPEAEVTDETSGPADNTASVEAGASTVEEHEATTVDGQESIEVAEGPEASESESLPSSESENQTTDTDAEEYQSEETAEVPDSDMEETGEDVAAQSDIALFAARVDLSGVEGWPLSLRAMMAGATIVPEVESLDTEDVAQTDAPGSALPDEDADADGQASEDDVVAPVSRWRVVCDEALLNVEMSEDDWMVTPVASFETAQIIVENGSRYVLTLENCAYIVDEASQATEPERPAQSFEGKTATMCVTAIAPEGAFPEGTEMRVADVLDTNTLDSIASTVEEDAFAVRQVCAVDITFVDSDGVEIEPQAPISVSMRLIETDASGDAVVVHVDDAGNAELVEQDVPETAGTADAVVAFTSDSFSVYAVVLTEILETRVIAADGETYHLSVRYSTDAGIPQNAELAVREITGEEYDFCRGAAEALLAENRSIELARFFDISILADGEEVQPAAPVEVRVELDDDVNENVQAVHFSESGIVQVLPADHEDDAVVFSADGFSVYGVVYTVDFEYSVNGNLYRFSLPGGGYITFHQMIEALGIGEDANGTDADQFVADIKSVSFSDPSLVWVGKVEEDSTVGQVKAAYGLESEYSSDLSEEQIRQIDGATIPAGEWALISLKAFATEENLTVTMMDGESFVIKVTDAQIKRTFISDSGETWEVTVEYGDDAQIPSTAHLKVKEILPEEKEYMEYRHSAIAKAGATTEEHTLTEEAGSDVDGEAAGRSIDEEAVVAVDGATGTSRTTEATYARFFDIGIWDGERQIEPAASVSVSIKLLDAPRDPAATATVLHFASAGLDVMESTETTETGLANPAAPAATEYRFRTDEFSVYGIVYTVVIETRVITASGETYVISVSYNQDAGIPENATLEAKEILEGTEEYAQYLEQSRMALNQPGMREATYAEESQDSEGVTLRGQAAVAQDIASARFFDLAIMANGEKVEPRAPVNVTIRYVEPVELDEAQNVQVVHFGDEAEVIEPTVSGKTDEAVDTFDFKATSFSVYGVLARFVTDADSGEFIVTGEDFRIRIVYGPEAQIPVGTVLTVRELDPESDEYIQRLGQAWYEVNREYFEVEEMLANYDEGMGDLPELHLVNLDSARFFDISFEHDGEKFEPGDAVHVEISYDEGLKALGDCEPITGVAHFGEEAVELIEGVETQTDANGGVVSFKYEQSSFSDTGTYVGQETYDALLPQRMAAAPVYDPAKAITLSASSVNDSNPDLPSPASSKTLVPNRTSDGHKDGTYTLTLSVAGSSRSNNTTEVNRSNVLIVMDRSSSMINNKVKTYTPYNGSYHNGTTYYGKDGDSYFTLYYNSRNGRYYRNYGFGGYSQEYTGQRYTATEGDKRLDAEQAALSSLISQLLAKNNEYKQDSQGYLLDENDERLLDEDGQPIKVNDIIEISVISFADRALGDYPRNDGVGAAPNYGTEVDWTTNYDTLMTGVNKDDAPSGTNWEDALKYAKYVADTKNAAQPDEPMFVLFLTDGEPTAYAGETGGAHHYGSTSEFDKAYTPAKDDAEALVTSGYKFYGIFTYGEGEAMIGYLKRLVNVAYGHDDNTAQTDDLTEHFHDAGDNDALMKAFQHILSRVSGTISVGNVTMADGLTTDATASTLVSGSADGFRYTVTGPLGELYSVTASGSNSNPTVTFTINGQNVAGEKKTEHVTRNQVDDDGNPIPDPNNPGKYLTVTEDKTYYSATVGNTEYKMALASIEDNGQITWDLSAVGTLMSGYSYNCSFVVWPDQQAYDYVAGLNNELPNYVWDQSAATAVLDENGDVVYWTGGVTTGGPDGNGYPSIVKLPDGTFSVLTNTNQSVTYSIVNTKTDETTGDTETTYDGPYTKPLEYPDPMDLTGSGLSITKYWDDSMDAQQLKDVVEDYAAEHDGAVYSITLTMYENGLKYKDYTFYPVWDAAQNRYAWKSADFSIAPALLVSRHPGGSKTYKTVTLNGVTYYVLNDGHEYTLDEEVVDYHFEFSADNYHPALVDGELYNVEFEVDDNGTIVNNSTAMIHGNKLETFTGTNTLKGRLYVEKETVVPAGTVGVDLESTAFDVTVTLTDREGQLISSPQDEDGNYDPQSGLMYRIHYGPNNPEGGEYDAEYQNYGRSEKLAVEDGVIAETLYSGDVIYVGNMPVGTHYEVVETSMPLGWKQVGIVAKNENGTVDSSQIIYGNKADYVTITNTVPSFDVSILKTREDGRTPLGGAHFKLYGPDYYVTDDNGDTVLNETPTLVADDLVSDMSTGLIHLGQLGGGEYYLVETSAPAGFLIPTEPIHIVVNGTSGLTKSYDEDPTTRPLYVTYTQEGNTLSRNGDGVSIEATALTDGSGAPMVDQDGNIVYNYSYTLTVTNMTGVTLPSTGGPGSSMFYLLGIMLILVSTLHLFRIQKRKYD